MIALTDFVTPNPPIPETLTFKTTSKIKEIPTQKTASPASQRTALAVIIDAIKAIWETIKSVVTGFFSLFTSCCFPREYFNSREITLLRDERSSQNPSTIPMVPIIDRTVTDKTPKPSLPGDEPFNRHEPTYTVFDDSLENMRSFTREFSVLGVDALYENVVADHLDTIQAIAPSLPPVIKSLAKLLVEMGDKASKPLFDSFSKQKSQTIDVALQKIFKTLLKPDLNLLREKLTGFLITNLADQTFEEGVAASDYINIVLNWISTAEEHRQPLDELFLKNKKLDLNLLKHLVDKGQSFWNDQVDDEKRRLYVSLEEKLIEEFKDTKVPAKQTIDYDYIRPILAWLLLSNHSIPLNNIFGVVDAQKEELIDKVFERLISMLVEKKVDQYSNFLEKTVQNHLGSIIHQAMQKNASRISDFFTERVSELITSMPFTETVDSLIHNAFHKHVQGVAISEDRREEERKLLEKTGGIATIVPTTGEALTPQVQAQNHLSTVTNRGGEKAYLEQMLLEAYSNEPASNSTIKQMIDKEIELIKQGKNPESARRINEKALYTTLSEDLLKLMMPVRKRIGSNGEIEDVDPFVELWDRLYLPDMYYELVKQFEDLTQEFATPETSSLLEKIKLPTIEILKKAFVEITKDKLKKQLESIAQTALEKVTNPAKIDKTNAENVLPSLNRNLLETFSRQVLSRNIKQFGPLFYELVTKDTFQHDESFKTLQQALIKEVKGKFEQFNPDQFYSKENDQAEIVWSGLSDDDWLKITQNIVRGLEKNILQAKINQKNFDPKTTSLNEVNDILKKAFSSDFKGNNANFGNLTMDLIFKLGKFDNEWLIGYFLKDKLSANITESVEPWRQSHKKLIDTLTESLRESFLNPTAVKDLLVDQAPKSAVLVEKQLANQIDVTSRLAYDLIMGISKEEGYIASYGAKTVLHGNSESINKTITNIYKKLFGNRTINQSLMVNICESVFKSLTVAADKVRMAETIKVQQLATTEKL